MLTASRWDLSHLRRAAAIALAVTSVGFAWSTASARDGAPNRASAAHATVEATDPGHNLRYWIRRINEPAPVTETDPELWATAAAQ